MPVEAVSTTGIYCRSTCSASPLQRNVTMMPSPVSAEAAGYRPCLRCRPDRHLLVAEAASGAPNAVVAALGLVSSGYLDHAGEDELARRVGYSTRQLRRLFERYVGATPDFVARSRRAHFARRLLDDSDLPLTQVARAAGFGSSRQMRRVVQRIFGFTPSELRDKRRRGDVPRADGGLTLRIAIGEPIDPVALAAYFAPRSIPGVEALDATVLRRTLATCGNDGLIEIDFGDPEELVVTAHLPTFDSLIDDIARVRHLFDLDVDHGDARVALAADPLLGPIVDRYPHVRVVGCWDRFEAAVRVIVGQQVSVLGASTVTGRIVARRGRPLRVVGPDAAESLTHHFPTADRLVDLDTHPDGEGLGMPGARVRAVAALARAVCDGTVDLGAPVDEARAALLAVPGIGPWTVEVIAMRALRDPDAFPAGDLVIRQALGGLLQSSAVVCPQASRPAADGLASVDLVNDIAESWRGHRALAAQYLWTAARDDLSIAAREDLSIAALDDLSNAAQQGASL